MKLSKIDEILNKKPSSFLLQVLAVRVIEDNPKKIINLLLCDGVKVIDNVVLDIKIHDIGAELGKFDIIKCEKFLIEYNEAKM